MVDPPLASTITSSGSTETERTFDGFGISTIAGVEGAAPQSAWFDIMSDKYKKRDIKHPEKQ